MLRRTIHIVVLVAGLQIAWAQTLSVPFFAQQKNGCGAASVAMVMHYWSSEQGDIDQYPKASDIYAALYDAKLRGIPLVDMKHYLEGNGFRAFTFHGRWSDVEQQLEKRRPLIISLKKKASSPMHFAVVTGAGRDEVQLNDPTHEGTTRMKREEFEKRWKYAETWMLLAVPSGSSSLTPKAAN